MKFSSSDYDLESFDNREDFSREDSFGIVNRIERLNGWGTGG